MGLQCLKCEKISKQYIQTALYVHTQYIQTCTCNTYGHNYKNESNCITSKMRSEATFVQRKCLGQITFIFLSVQLLAHIKCTVCLSLSLLLSQYFFFGCQVTTGLTSPGPWQSSARGIGPINPAKRHFWYYGQM